MSSSDDDDYCSYHERGIDHISEKENKIDPDDGNSWLCSACTLPIFSTPFQCHEYGGSKLRLHDECANLPREVFGHSLHSREKLILKEKKVSNFISSSCSSCHRECGSSIYACSFDWCKFKLDVLCAFQIKIMHRSHQHRLTVMKAGSASFICGACDTRHEENMSALFYFCNLCQFWIHSDCASLPNAINLMHHRQHSLFLTYGLPGRSKYECAICRSVIQSLGVYFCAGCHYFAHIHCAKSKSFESVRIQAAKLPGLLHFPLKENTSVMRYIFENTASSSVDDRDQTGGKLVRQVLHRHPLILDDQIDGGDESITPRVCSACVQLISPPFYSCSECPDFFLHDCCANLPSQIKHSTHEHPLSLLPKAPNSSVSGFFYCHGCDDGSNRFTYSCSTCYRFNIDVVCASFPPAITHELHGNMHVLYMSPDRLRGRPCKCCGTFGGIFYECSACHDFIIHAKCALFPSSIKHKYDEHPLKLTTDNDGEQICEICEQTIYSWDMWYYSCGECEQSFHRDCIPSVNICSRIKLGSTIHVDRHDCPLTLVLEITLDRYHCGYCSRAFQGTSYDDRPAYECSKCYFRIHGHCASECLQKCSETQKSISMI